MSRRKPIARRKRTHTNRVGRARKSRSVRFSFTIRFTAFAHVCLTTRVHYVTVMDGTFVICRRMVANKRRKWRFEKIDLSK